MQKAPTRILERHAVETVVVSCIDFRFRAHLEKAVENAFGVSEFDLIQLAGGAKNLTPEETPSRQRAVIDDLGIACEKHHASKIILLNHQQCGKYAAAGRAFTDPTAEHSFHEKELRLAYEMISSFFPAQQILLGYMRVNTDNQVVIDRVTA